jgi:polyisoprenoid-binding protein YceI
MSQRVFAFGIKLFTVASAIALSASAAWVAQGQKLASFKALGPGGLAIVGTDNELTVAEHENRVEVTVGLQGLKTGIELRDRHMKEKYLETQKYPNAVLVVEKAKLTIPTAGADVPGKFTVHGVTKPVNVHYTATGTAKQAHIDGNFTINIKDYGIVVPNYLGVTVKPDVLVSAKFDANDK